jgi:molybdopterin-binding protein
MALVVKDRVRETSTTTGTGTFTLAGAVAGFQTFSSAIGNTNTTYYTITNNTEWEVGIGTVGAGTLARTTILASSNSGSAVSFSAGTKDVFCTYPAGKAVTTDAIGTIASQNSNNVSITGGSIAVTSDPTTALQVATKQYVDAAISGLHVHDAVAAATTAALTGTVTYNNGTSGVGATLTLGTALTTLDGYTLLNGDRVLVKNQANAAHNGIYTWATGGTVLTRATDADTPTELNGGDFFFVVHGTVNNDTGWVITSAVTTIGTSDVNFTQFSGAGTYTAGTGLTLTGSQFAIDSTVTTLTGSQTLTNKSLTSPTITGQATFAAGTAAAPAITTTGDTNTGMFFPAADSIAFVEGGIEVMRINSAGDVGIGTVSPDGNLHVYENASASLIRVTSSTTGVAGIDFGDTDAVDRGQVRYFNNGDYLLLATSATEALRIESDKNLKLSGGYTEAVVATGTVGSSATLSLANGTVITATLTSATACTFTMPTATAGKSFIVLLKQPASGTPTTATFTGVKYPVTGAPTITATLGKMDILTFVADGTNWYGSYSQGYTP